MPPVEKDKLVLKMPIGPCNVKFDVLTLMWAATKKDWVGLRNIDRNPQHKKEARSIAMIIGVQN